ncbi:hypothetical protein AMATHDRAFT_144238 [Amanita thiersii Skay4041]|uniref:Protein kinase domain-containing protein n=1 Tax=Amanita thiersii Skay4041 TaxID=703135 RepID=A0A2A9NN97_9AGAR|nr:hypothetical protein AMATHDRAFT_144238 [Amanita thiersii Skay4041]
MSDDPRATRLRRRLYIANPDPDDVDNSDDDPTNTRNINLSYHDSTNYQNTSWYPTPPYPPHQSPPLSRYPPPLFTSDLAPVPPQNQSHPGLSPSNTSSPAAEESTPPPTTPGLPPPPIDPVNNDMQTQEPSISVYVERTPIDTANCRPIKTIRASPFHQQGRGPRPAESHPRRPRTSPTTTIPDLHTPTSSQISTTLTPTIDKSETGKLLIVVTADSERYVTVDITGAKNAAFIRECIFSKLQICQDEEQSQYSIYKTEIGDFAIGGALTDDQLFSLCRDRGDNKGSLKFLISHKNAVVHEDPPRPYSPLISSVPPPVLPSSNIPPSPLRIKHRSRSRHGSVSSASEQMTTEATGYEADLDNADKDKDVHKSSGRYQQPQQTGHSNNMTSSANLRRPSGPLQRPSSPLRPIKVNTPSPVSLERSRPSEEAQASDRFAQPKNASSNPPPLSPLRPNFPILEDNVLPAPSTLPTHTRSGSDAGAEREQALKASEQQLENATRAWKARQKPSPGSSRENVIQMTVKDSRSRRDKLKPEPDENWVFVASGGESESNLLPPESRMSPSASRSHRQHNTPTRYGTAPYAGRTITIPNPPNRPPPPAPPRAAGVPVPPNYLVTWKGEEGGSRTSSTKLAKAAKSMDNLRAVFTYPSLATGSRRNPPQLPPSRSGGVTHYEHSYYGGLAAVGPKSFESSRPIRPLPLQGSTHSASLDLSQAAQPTNRTLYSSGASLSPNNEPFVRPQSAHGDSATSPSSSYLRHPRYTSEFHDNPRSPRSMSPSQSNPTSMISTSTSRQHYSDRSSDTYSGTETTRTTPPRSPASPLSPQCAPQRDGVDNALSNKLAVFDEDELSPRSTNRSSEATVKQEDRSRLTELLGHNSESTLIVPRHNEVEKGNPPSPSTGTSTATLTSPVSPYSQYDEESDSELGTLMWKKRPEDLKSHMRGPPLTVRIANAEENSSREQLQRSTANKAHSSTPKDKRPRGSTFTDMSDSTWAPRPPPEDMYDRLEEFFPEHDLDKPVIESGGTSPTSAEPSAALATVVPVPERKGGIRAKRSIRYVAEDFKKRINRTSRANPSTHVNDLRKRNTKLWGSRLEEVTTAYAKSGSTPSDSSASGFPTFKWVRGELIGKGTYGRVYLAMNANTGEMMAVKQVELPQTPSDRNDSRQASVVQALKLECETLKELDHPNIVQYLGFEETPSNLSIFLEYVPGGSVGSCLLKHGRFDENVTKSFTYQILDGLHYLHSQGILHRDLKADNILVEMSGICKISDFGISKRTDDIGGGAFTAMQGTVFWMAPEVINTQKKGYNFKVDIWSVGCVVLEMWAGKRPWTGEEMVAVMFKLYQSKLPPPVPDDVSLSELADDFRKRCFAINPEERATAVELMAHPYLKLPPAWHFIKFT